MGRNGWFVTGVAGETRTMSCFVQSGGGYQLLIGGIFGDEDALFNPETLTWSAIGTDVISYGHDATTYANGWIRVWVIYTFTDGIGNGGAYAGFRVRDATGGTTIDGTSGVRIWGCQYEDGIGKLTSYIKTTNASVTRARDVIEDKASITNVFSTTDFTVFFKGKVDNQNAVYKHIKLETADASQNVFFRFFNGTFIISSTGVTPESTYYTSTRDTTDGIIVVGHTKRSTIVDEDHSKVIDINELNLTGKLKNELMSAADAIGFVFREDGNLKISFKTGSDNTQTGSRCPHLANQVLDFEWNKIFID